MLNSRHSRLQLISNQSLKTGLIALAIIASPFTIAEEETLFGNEKYNGKLTLFIELGAMQGDLDWNIADPNGTPNVLSELKYNINSSLYYGFGAQLAITSGPISHGFLKLRRRVILQPQGTAHDTDYSTNDRKGLYSHSESEITGDEHTLTSIGAGYKFEITKYFTLSPVVGYATQQQDFRVTNGTQIVSIAPQSVQPLGPFSGLNSTYKTRWKGAWLGLDSQLSMTDEQSLQLSLEYHFPDYSAEANWNLRENLEHPISFKHYGNDEYGYRFSLSYGYKITNSWTIQLNAEYEQFGLKSGTDKLFTNGLEIESPLNEVNWEAAQFGIRVSKMFIH